MGDCDLEQLHLSHRQGALIQDSGDTFYEVRHSTDHAVHALDLFHGQAHAVRVAIEVLLKQSPHHGQLCGQVTGCRVV